MRHSRLMAVGWQSDGESEEQCQEKHSGNNGVEGGGAVGGVVLGVGGGGGFAQHQVEKRAGPAGVNKSFTGRHKHTQAITRARVRSQ